MYDFLTLNSSNFLLFFHFLFHQLRRNFKFSIREIKIDELGIAPSKKSEESNRGREDRSFRGSLDINKPDIKNSP